MRASARLILVLHSDAQFMDRIRRVASGSYLIEGVDHWSALRTAVVQAPPSALVIVDPYFGEAPSNPLAPELRALLVDFPSLPMFAALEVQWDRRDDLRTLGKWGIVEVISIGHDDTPTALRQRFRRAIGRPLKALLEGVLPPGTSLRARAIVDAAAETVAIAGHAHDLAHALGLSRRTLLRWSEQADLPPPRRLLAWMRILLAAELLDDPGRSVRSVALTCGYASDSGLRRVTQQFVGASPSQLRRQGAFARVARVFLQTLAGCRRPTEV